MMQLSLIIDCGLLIDLTVYCCYDGMLFLFSSISVSLVHYIISNPTFSTSTEAGTVNELVIRSSSFMFHFESCPIDVISKPYDSLIN